MSITSALLNPASIASMIASCKPSSISSLFITGNPLPDLICECQDYLLMQTKAKKKHNNSKYYTAEEYQEHGPKTNNRKRNCSPDDYD
jgi:hypothetical protein